MAPILGDRRELFANSLVVDQPTTATGIAFAMLPPQDDTPAPTLLLLASTGTHTLMTEPYCRVGRLLHAEGWNIVSLDLPCHGADRRTGEPEELAGWAARTAAGEDIVATFQARVNAVVEHLVAKGMADPARIAAAGTSRGGFMALHAAAGNPRIRAVAAFAPVTDLTALREFTGQSSSPLVRRLAVAQATETLADRTVWITIGDADTRVDTGKAVALARMLERAAGACGLPPQVALHVVPVPGHVSLAEWHVQAANWLGQMIPAPKEHR